MFTSISATIFLKGDSNCPESNIRMEKKSETAIRPIVPGNFMKRKLIYAKSADNTTSMEIR